MRPGADVLEGAIGGLGREGVGAGVGELKTARRQAAIDQDHLAIGHAHVFEGGRRAGRDLVVVAKRGNGADIGEAAGREAADERLREVDDNVVRRLFLEGWHRQARRLAPTHNESFLKADNMRPVGGDLGRQAVGAGGKIAGHDPGKGAGRFLGHGIAIGQRRA